MTISTNKSLKQAAFNLGINNNVNGTKTKSSSNQQSNAEKTSHVESPPKKNRSRASIKRAYLYLKKLLEKKEEINVMNARNGVPLPAMPLNSIWNANYVKAESKLSVEEEDNEQDATVVIKARQKSSTSPIDIKQEEEYDKNILISHISINTDGTSSKFEAEPATGKQANIYCETCKIQLSCKRTFKRHILSRTHHQKLESLNYHVPLDPDLPDINDPNLYCKVCQRTYSRRDNYHEHLRTQHGMNINIRPRPNLSIVPDVNDTNSYCKSCDYTYGSRSDYRRHLRRVHDMEIPFEGKRKSIVRSKVAQYWNAPQFYCKSCNRKSKNRAVCHIHLRVVHNVKNASVS